MANDMASMNSDDLTRGGRLLILVTAFLGWLLAGTNMAIVPLAGRSAALGLRADASEGQVGVWFSAFTCAFLLGAAAGGLLFGAIGDRVGRARAMGLSILCYSLFSGLGYFVQTPGQFWLLRFLACLGIGGVWPNGVALASEAWSEVSRPLLSGLIGTAANLGFMVLAVLAMIWPISPESWRWVLLVGASPWPIGLFVLLAVPESKLWLNTRKNQGMRVSATTKTRRDFGNFNTTPRRSAIAEVFRPPLLKLTLIGICLGAVPLMGNWGGANWLVPWSGQVGQAEGMDRLKAWTQWSKSGGAAVGSLLGGWLASQFGRRKTYFIVSLVTLGISNYIFWRLRPGEEHFHYWVGAVGFFGTIYFGWLPLYLPELFPTSVRATGSGVTFNFGRIATAVGVLLAGQLMAAFGGDYARMGRVTCWVYLLGMIVICFAPDTSKKRMNAES
jgi:MFS family permease